MQKLSHTDRETYIKLIEDGNAALEELVGDLLGPGKGLEGGGRVC